VEHKTTARELGTGLESTTTDSCNFEPHIHHAGERNEVSLPAAVSGPYETIAKSLSVWAGLR
jgi:hypothetical protein